MIKIELDNKSVQEIINALGESSKQSKVVLKNALNDTAKQARKDLFDRAKMAYTIKSGRFNKAMKIKNATLSVPEAYIRAKGQVLALTDFRTRANGSTSAAKAKVVNTNSMKELTLKGASDSGTDLKAFVLTVGRHKGIFQRMTKEQREKQQIYFNSRKYKAGSKTGKKNAIRQLYSSSIPKMIGDEQKVYGIVKPDIEKNLTENLQKHINDMLGGKL